MKSEYLSIALLLGASIWHGTAHAGEYCLLDGTELFSCTFNDGAKAVELCDALWEDGDKLSYGFFKTGGAVEKEIVQEKTDMFYTPWNGTGSYVTESVTFDGGGGYAYEVWAGGEREPDAQLEGGINVLKDNSVIANLTCDAGSVTSDIDLMIELIEMTLISP